MSLLVSVTFLSLHLALEPLRRAEDRVLMALIQLALILMYIVVLLIKTCMVSSVACALFGFGDEAGGLYLFFVFFGLGMLVLQLIIGAIHLYWMGYVPKLLLVAKAHGVSPMVIVQSTPSGIEPRRCFRATESWVRSSMDGRGLTTQGARNSSLYVSHVPSRPGASFPTFLGRYPSVPLHAPRGAATRTAANPHGRHRLR